MANAAKKMTTQPTAAEREVLVEELCDELNNYNIADVSRLSGMSEAALYFWLDGRTKHPRLQNIVKVARVIGMELSWRKQPHLELVVNNK